jgi:hypothetical protein
VHAAGGAARAADEIEARVAAVHPAGGSRK